MTRRVTGVVPLRRSRWSLVAAGVAALALTGCTTTVAGTGRAVGAAGTHRPPVPAGSSPSATGTRGGDAGDLVADMVGEMKLVDKGFAVKGDFDAGGGGSASLDLRMQAGTGRGTLTFNGATCRIEAVDGKGWANAPTAFWTDRVDLGDDVARQIAGRWVELSGDIDFLLAFVDQDSFLDTLLSGGDHFTLGDRTTVGGVAAQEVEGGTDTFVVAAAAPHLLLEIDEGRGTTSFTYPNSDVRVEPPSPTIAFPG